MFDRIVGSYEDSNDENDVARKLYVSTNFPPNGCLWNKHELNFVRANRLLPPFSPGLSRTTAVYVREISRRTRRTSCAGKCTFFYIFATIITRLFYILTTRVSSYAIANTRRNQKSKSFARNVGARLFLYLFVHETNTYSYEEIDLKYSFTRRKRKMYRAQSLDISDVSRIAHRRSVLASGFEVAYN